MELNNNINYLELWNNLINKKTPVERYNYLKKYSLDFTDFSRIQNVAINLISEIENKYISIKQHEIPVLILSKERNFIGIVNEETKKKILRYTKNSEEIYNNTSKNNIFKTYFSNNMLDDLIRLKISMFQNSGLLLNEISKKNYCDKNKYGLFKEDLDLIFYRKLSSKTLINLRSPLSRLKQDFEYISNNGKIPDNISTKDIPIFFKNSKNDIFTTNSIIINID